MSAGHNATYVFLASGKAHLGLEAGAANRLFRWPELRARISIMQRRRAGGDP